MASSGPNSPGTATDDSSVGTVAWILPENVTASDNQRATFSTSTAKFSHYIKATNFGFSIPSATIDGILVEVEVNGGENSRDVRVSLVKGGTVESTNKATNTSPGSESYKTYGGAADLWSSSWATSDINSSSFGVVYQVEGTSPVGFGNTVNVDHIRITVYYTAGGGANPKSVMRGIMLAGPMRRVI